ncbi:MAG: DEAD/DEAH box helicase [Methanolobus sp.]|nr:DEAD/DEAH box helicase [Methanolobus sp.]
MYSKISNAITIYDPSEKIHNWCKENLIIRNPDYETKKRLGKYYGNIPEYLYLYEKMGNSIVLPYGTGFYIYPFIKDSRIETDFSPTMALTMEGDVSLYPYQSKAIQAIFRGRNGILVAPCGSGKTQVGIALIKKIGLKTLWITHTLDLLNQSMERAKEYFKGDFGTITGGKVNIGKDITFATVQTMASLDLNRYKNQWNVIIVDECHKVVGAPTRMMQFYKVINSLKARYKYGLSATIKVKHSKDISKSTLYIIGPVLHEITEEDVGTKIIKSQKKIIELETPFSREYLRYDGMLDFNKLIDYLINNEERNKKIVEDLKENEGKSCLILSHRVAHLYLLQEMLGVGTVLIGGIDKITRKKIIEKTIKGEIKYLFSTYALAKEGLDIPCLNRLFMVTPKKDYITVKQSVGRIERNIPGKDIPVVYDYVDKNIPHLVGFYKKRKSIYK